MDQTDRQERHVRRSGVAQGMLAPLLSSAHWQTTSLFARHYGYSAPLWRDPASVRLAVPPAHIPAYVCARLFGNASARPTVVFARGATIVEYQTPPCSGVADGVLLERPAHGGSSQGSAIIWAD